MCELGLFDSNALNTNTDLPMVMYSSFSFSLWFIRTHIQTQILVNTEASNFKQIYQFLNDTAYLREVMPCAIHCPSESTEKQS